jgi:hypothetical protein
MASEVNAAKRLVSLQRRVAEQKRLKLANCQRSHSNLIGLGEAVAKTLDDGGLAWQLFPDMSNRFLSKLMAEKAIAAMEVQSAGESAARESKRLEILDARLEFVQHKEELRKDDEQRLESTARRSASSFPQA